MFADLLGRCRSRRRAVDHGCVAVDGGRLAGDRRRDHVDVENSAVGKETTDGELIDLTEPPPRSITNGPPYHQWSSVPLRTGPPMRALRRADQPARAPTRSAATFVRTTSDYTLDACHLPRSTPTRSTLQLARLGAQVRRYARLRRLLHKLRRFLYYFSVLRLPHQAVLIGHPAV